MCCFGVKIKYKVLSVSHILSTELLNVDRILPLFKWAEMQYYRVNARRLISFRINNSKSKRNTSSRRVGVGEKNTFFLNSTCLGWRSEVSEFHCSARCQQPPTDGAKLVSVRPTIQSRRRGDNGTYKLCFFCLLAVFYKS